MRSPIRENKKLGKHQRSSFLLTINTNVTDQAMCSKLKSAFNTFYDHLEDFITFKETTKSLDLIDSADCEVAIEQGPKYKRIHLHAIVVIGHRTKLHLNLSKLRTFFKQQLGIESFHLKMSSMFHHSTI